MPSERPSRVGPAGMGLALISLIVVAVGLVVALFGGALPGLVNPTVTKSVAVQSISSAKTGTALAALATLAVKGRAPKMGYDRALFGQAWADVDRNGCDTRNDVLRRDLTTYVLKMGTRGCLVLSGILRDPYTATTIAFVRGQSTSAEVQIDHVVALSDAWQKGAQQWSTPRRTAFANDSLNLLAVDGPTNANKGDGDAATWLPPNKAYRCSYAARQVAVKVKYGLWATSAEHDALARILATCPSQTLPTAAPFVLGGGRE
ncbi:MAG: HNH endonuclease family protein [Dermatophilaceae bacterium]